MLLHVAMVSGQACSNACSFSNDGECDDGRAGSAYFTCPLGTDCADCGNAVGLATHCTCDNADAFLGGGVVNSPSGSEVACANARSDCSFSSWSCSQENNNGAVKFTWACSGPPSAPAPTSGSTPSTTSSSSSLKLCTSLKQSTDADCSGEICADIPDDQIGKCNPLGTGMYSKTTCSGGKVTQEVHDNADCSDDTSATCADLAALSVGGCSHGYDLNTCIKNEFTMGLSQKFKGSCPGEEEPCFSREAEACRVLDTSVAPSAAFRACFDEPAPTVAERVKMTALTGGDYVLSAGKDQAYEFTRVIVNQHKLNEARRRHIRPPPPP